VKTMPIDWGIARAPPTWWERGEFDGIDPTGYFFPTYPEVPPDEHCRLGIKGVRTDWFIGDMDDLFVADRALEPQDIVRLMNENQL
jgi:hypothetical protein